MVRRSFSAIGRARASSLGPLCTLGYLEIAEKGNWASITAIIVLDH